MGTGNFFQRGRRFGSGKRREPETAAAEEDFERLPEFEPIIAAARKAESMPVPVAFTDSVMQSISASAVPQQTYTCARVERWVFASSARELGHCFLITGFFYLVLALTLFWGLHLLPEASDRLHWQPAASLAAGLLCGAAGWFLIFDGAFAVRVAELSAAAGIGLLVLAAANGIDAAERPLALTATAFFVPAASGPLLFLIAAAHRFQTRALGRDDSMEARS